MQLFIAPAGPFESRLPMRLGSRIGLPASASRVGCGDGDGPSWVVFVESHGWTGGVINQVIRVDLLVTQLALAAWFANGCDMDAVDNVARSQ